MAKARRLAGIPKNASTRPQAAAWYREQALAATNASGSRIKESVNSSQTLNRINDNHIGKMYFFMYDPKHKATLPYYDTFPLIFPIELYKDGFLGINLHYLPPMARARLMDALYETVNNKRYDATTKLKINYQILKGASQYSAFKPCIKRYLFSFMRSNFIRINPEVWDYALQLPVANFQKQSQETVWLESMLKF